MKGSYINQKGNEVFSIGKYKDKFLSFVLDKYPWYFKWLRQNTDYTFSDSFEEKLKQYWENENKD